MHTENPTVELILNPNSGFGESLKGEQLIKTIIIPEWCPSPSAPCEILNLEPKVIQTV